MRINISAIILLCLLSISCDKEVTNGLPGFEPKLVVTSFISPTDSISKIRVTSNRPVYGEQLPYQAPGNLSGWISDGDKKVELHITDDGLAFTKDELPVINGKTYSLEITNDQGLKATASCTVPEKFDYGMRIDTFSVIKEARYMDGTSSKYRQPKIDFIFSDQPGKNNYYRIVTKTSNYQYGRLAMHTFEIRFDNTFFRDKDERSDDDLITVSAGNISENNLDSSFIKVYLMEVEESYYLYHKSLTNFKDDDNPFTEPTVIYTNVEGGMGVFTSFAVDSLMFRLK